ncbi:MAG: hypothetical protein AAFO70_08690 [Pseudomonadota bacterium]
MIRLVDTAFIVAAIAGALWTYNIKHEADEQAATLKDLRAEIRAETDRIAVLEADWAIATTPSRLAEIVAQHGDDLALEEMASEQILTEETWPALRPLPEPMMEASGPDTLSTGSIEALLEQVETLE